MISLPLPEFVTGAFLRFVVKPVLGPPFSFGVQRLWLEATSLLTQPPNGQQRSRRRLGGVPAIAITAKHVEPEEARGPVVLYFHGGAFVVGSHRTHAGLTGYLAKALGDDAVVYSLDYRLAPENPWPAGFDDALSAYRALTARGVAPQRIVVAGDSAGGVMVVDLLLALRERGEAGPAGAVLLSPAVGIDMARPDGVGTADTLVTKAWAEQAFAVYARPTADPAQRVLGRDFTGLPPIYLQFSTGEVLAAENRTFLHELRAHDVVVEVREDEGAFHVLALVPGLMKRARSSVADAAGFVARAVEQGSRRPSSRSVESNGAAKPAVPGHEVA